MLGCGWEEMILPHGHGEVDPQLQGSTAAPVPFSQIRTHSSS